MQVARVGETCPAQARAARCACDGTVRPSGHGPQPPLLLSGRGGSFTKEAIMVSGTAVGAAVATTTRVVKNVVFKFANDWSMNLASMIAYNLITAIFPILLAVLSLVGLVLRLTAYGHIQDVATAISRVFPREITTSIDLTSLLKSLIDITGPLAIAALLGLLWLGSNLFSNMENAFSIIFRIRVYVVIKVGRRATKVGPACHKGWADAPSAPSTVPQSALPATPPSPSSPLPR